MSPRYREEQAGPDGWSRWVYPNLDRYLMKCCDCGLVHAMQFRVTDDNHVEFRARRVKSRRKKDSTSGVKHTPKFRRINT